MNLQSNSVEHQSSKKFNLGISFKVERVTQSDSANKHFIVKKSSTIENDVNEFIKKRPEYKEENFLTKSDHYNEENKDSNEKGKGVNMSGDKKFKTGRWTSDEHRRFIEAILKYGNEWRKVQKHVATRSSTQARSHAQKFFAKVKRNGKEGEIGKQLLKNLEDLNESSLDEEVTVRGSEKSSCVARVKKSSKPTNTKQGSKMESRILSKVTQTKNMKDDINKPFAYCNEQIKQNTTDSFLSNATTSYLNNKFEHSNQPIIINNNIKNFNININSYEGFDMLSCNRNFNDNLNNLLHNYTNGFNYMCQLNSRLTQEQEFQNSIDEMFKCDRLGFNDNRHDIDLLESFENNFISNTNNNFSSFLTANRRNSFDVPNPLSFDNLNK